MVYLASRDSWKQGQNQISPEPALLHRRRPTGDHPSDPAMVAFRIPLVAGDDMEVEVHDRLACIPPHVHPDIVPVRMVKFVDPTSCLDDQVEERGTLFLRRIKEGLVVAEGNYEHMPSAHGEPVNPCIGKIIPDQDILFTGVAKGAARLGLGYWDHPGMHYQGIMPEKG